MCCVDGHINNSAVVVLISHDNKISSQAKEDVCFNHPINTHIAIYSHTHSIYSSSRYNHHYSLTSL